MRPFSWKKGAETLMKAHVGDMIEVRRRDIDDIVRRGEVLEVRGEEGEPPYLIQWDDSPHRCIYFPGGDALVRHLHQDPSSR
jgi:Domain of unknown function (DUF1918)